MSSKGLGASSYVGEQVAAAAPVDGVATIGRSWLEIVALPVGEVRGHG